MTFIEPLYQRAQSMWLGFVEVMPLLVVAALCLLLSWGVAAFSGYVIRTSLARSSIRPALTELLVSLMRVTVWVIGVLIAATVIFPSLTPGKLLTVLGLGSVAVGLAFKDIFENFFAGVLIMLRRPMRINDFVECEQVRGRVEKITVRETYLRKTDGQLVLVPNSFLFKNPVHVLTDLPIRRFDLVVGVAYSEDIDTARRVILEALSHVEEIEHQRGVEVYAREFNASSLDFTVRWWAASQPIDMHQSRDKVVTAIKRALDTAGIEIPFPYRTLTFKEPLTLKDSSTSTDSSTPEARDGAPPKAPER
ncbi:mechanosensitive ion channel family protein [Larsenimonas suaedae]|uniref:Small-conductance mechanosensitive channel n=1 Tax=Larsenimonas suaedae TaxID=1851019 RepID=A0ABU1GW38_9GAMM|nr:mechanosensitive ion channel family protein [Larsenimonas suaedae]MCM2973373.1 mechanosensitive ion channel family protein [Larsenimonas suaedae]MDR5896266.1 mechanosensitive ion channel family protein [Larsenimonas suaedae]